MKNGGHSVAKREDFQWRTNGKLKMAVSFLQNVINTKVKDSDDRTFVGFLLSPKRQRTVDGMKQELAKITRKDQTAMSGSGKNQ
jgi:hypothetical protein